MLHAILLALNDSYTVYVLYDLHAYSKFAHFFVVHFLRAPWTLHWDEPALSLQMLFPLTLQKKLGAAILLVRAWDLLKLARSNVLLFEVCDLYWQFKSVQT